MKRKFISVGLVSVLLLGLWFFSSVWDRYPGGFWIIFFGLTITFLLAWLTIKLIREIIWLVKNRTLLRTIHFGPTIIIILTLSSVWFDRISDTIEDRLFGSVVFRACYEGTQSQSTFKLRENNRFEIHSSGVFFYDRYFMGVYKLNADTLILTYDGEVYNRVGDKVYMNHEDKRLIPTKDKSDSTSILLKYYYYGYCKGLN